MSSAKPGRIADAGVVDWRHRLVRHWLLRRFRFAVRLRASRYSLGVALRRGLQIGLPFAAILAATVPVWGMSWFFDTENWAAGMWNSWAESRTDEWREATVTRVIADERQAGRPAPDFSLSPPGLDGDFSFIVIGDTSEGDASQHSLRDEPLRAQYRVPTGFQKAPFFQIQTRGVALIAVDTGVVKSVDPAELAWFRAALDGSRGKFAMVVLGHPLYAGGAYQATDNEAFASIHRLLQDYKVPLVMAGDTHDLEYYAEPPRAGGQAGAVHIVNGGGGAYMSFGTALDWPASPATAEWAFYPTTAQVREKLNALTPIWKWPAWWWTQQFGGWPFSAEGLAGIFDYNQAPFFQSFGVVHVEPSAHRIRLWAVGVHGRLTWADIETSAGLHPADVPVTAPIEWTIPF